MFTDKVYTALDHAPAAFDLRGRIFGPNGNNLDYIKSETGAVVILKGGSSSSDPLHVVLQHSRTDGVAAARSLTLNLVETVKNELQQWSAQTGQVVPPAPGTVPAAPPVSSATPEAVPQPVNIAPAPASAASSVVSVRPQTLLQLMPQQQYILNQDGSQLIPLMQPGQIPGQGNFTQLFGSFPQASNATQFVDANLQPVSMAQFRLSSIPNSMPTFIQNGVPLSQVSLGNQDTTTVSYTSLLPVSSTVSSPSTGAGPVVHATQTVGQKVQWSTEKTPEKGAEVKYQYQTGGGEVQLTMPAGAQTMYIPYQQLQELTGQPGSGQGLQPQFVSISAGGGSNGWPAGTSLPMQQITQLPPGATLNPNILQLNQKPASANTSVINLWSAQPGSTSLPSQITPAQQIITPASQAWSSQQMQIAASQGTTLTPIPPNTPWVRAPGISSALPQGAELIPLNPAPKSSSGHEPRAQKRLSDGTVTQIQLRPIAPAGVQISHQDKTNSSRDSRPQVWAASTGRENSGNSANQITLKSSGSRGSLPISLNNTLSSTASTTTSARDITASPARQVEKIVAPLSQDGSTKPVETLSKGQSLPQNIQMYAVSNNGGQIQSMSQLPTSLAQANSPLNQMYFMQSSHGAGLQGVSLPPNAVMGPTLQVGQGHMSMMQPNQLTLPHGVQYNTVPLMQLPQQMQYITSGLNLNNPALAQQLGLTMAGQQVLNPAMLANLQSSNPNQMAQLNQASLQGLNTQAVPGSQTSGNIQYSSTQLQNAPQATPQFITSNPQQVVSNTSLPYVVPTTQYAGNTGQFTNPQGNYIMPAPGNVPPQYSLINQQISATTQLNPSLQINQSEVRGNGSSANQPATYSAANAPNGNQPNVFGPGVTQPSFPSGTQISQAAPQQAYPATASPSVNQLSDTSNPHGSNYSSGTPPNQPGNFQQANGAANSFPSGNAAQTVQPAQFAGNQYAAANKSWTGQRFSSVPPGSVATQYTIPRAGPPSAPASSTPNPTNYWQYS